MNKKSIRRRRIVPEITVHKYHYFSRRNSRILRLLAIGSLKSDEEPVKLKKPCSAGMILEEMQAVNLNRRLVIMSYSPSSEFEPGDPKPSSTGSKSGGIRPVSPARSGYDKSANGRSKEGQSETADGSRPGSTAASAEHQCSYCNRTFLRSESKNMPFCSRRCQHIDLGMWLNESYGLPHEGESSLDSYGIQDEEE